MIRLVPRRSHRVCCTQRPVPTFTMQPREQGNGDVWVMLSVYATYRPLPCFFGPTFDASFISLWLEVYLGSSWQAWSKPSVLYHEDCLAVRCPWSCAILEFTGQGCSLGKLLVCGIPCSTLRIKTFPHNLEPIIWQLDVRLSCRLGQALGRP